MGTLNQIFISDTTNTMLHLSSFTTSLDPCIEGQSIWIRPVLLYKMQQAEDQGCLEKGPWLTNNLVLYGWKMKNQDLEATIITHHFMQSAPSLEQEDLLNHSLF